MEVKECDGTGSPIPGGKSLGQCGSTDACSPLKYQPEIERYAGKGLIIVAESNSSDQR